MGYLGLQDKTRKRRHNHQTSEECIGYTTLSPENIHLFLTATDRKWGRDRNIICDLFAKFNEFNHFTEMDLKDMERKTEFLVQLDMAYPSIKPFLRGLYLAMKSWQPKRDRDGWK